MGFGGFERFADLADNLEISEDLAVHAGGDLEQVGGGLLTYESIAFFRVEGGGGFVFEELFFERLGMLSEEEEGGSVAAIYDESAAAVLRKNVVVEVVNFRLI